MIKKTVLEMFSRSSDPRHTIEARWRRLYRLAYCWCHDRDLASDLAQETVLRALRASGAIPAPNELDVWLFRILYNCWCDHLRGRRETVDIESAALRAHTEPDDDAYRHEVFSRIRAAVARLCLAQRQVFTLVVVEGMSYGEVAGVLDIPIGTVMSRLSRARQNLKDYLSDLGPTAREKTTRVWRVK